MMRSGSLDRRIRIEQPVETDDGRQTRVTGWNEVATVWAQYVPMKGREAREALGREASMPATFRIRWSRRVADVAPGWLLRFQDRIYRIKSAVEIGRRDGIEILAEAGDDRAV